MLVSWLGWRFVSRVSPRSDLDRAKGQTREPIGAARDPCCYKFLRLEIKETGFPQGPDPSEELSSMTKGTNPPCVIPHCY